MALFNYIEVFPNRYIQCKHLYIKLLYKKRVCKHAQHFILSLHMKMIL